MSELLPSDDDDDESSSSGCLSSRLLHEPAATRLRHATRFCATATQSRETPMAWAPRSRLKPTARSSRAKSCPYDRKGRPRGLRTSLIHDERNLRGSLPMLILAT